jgi:hypothetical protein
MEKKRLDGIYKYLCYREGNYGRYGSGVMLCSLGGYWSVTVIVTIRIFSKLKVLGLFPGSTY